MSTGKIERIAVEAIRTEANHPSSKLIAEVADGDKGISFDGEIKIFKDLKETVHSLLGRIPVQIKGTQVKQFSPNTRSFSLEIDHYKNYYNGNGAILFVVEILRTGESKIFYKQLLPKELFEIIRYFGENKQQKSRSLTLRSLSETNLYAVCFKFIQERVKQPQMLVESNPFPEYSFTEYNLTSLTFNPYNMLMKDLLEHDFTVYGVHNSLSVPLHHVKPCSVETTQLEIFHIKDNSYALEVQTKIKKNKRIRRIENSLEIILDEKTNKIQFNMNNFHSLSSQLKVTPLLIDILTSATLRLPDGTVELENDKSNALEVSINDLKSFHKKLIEIEKTFILLNINKNTIITAPKRSLIIESLFLLVEAVLYNNTSVLRISPEDSSNFINYPIGDLNIILFYDPRSERKLVNAFSEEVSHSFLTVGNGNYNEGFPHSIYILLNNVLLAYATNIDFEIIKNSFTLFDPFLNELVFSVTNNFCLTCIKAYDKSKRTEFLVLATYILEKYEFKTINSSFDNATILVNLFQTKIRLDGDLSSEEHNELINLKNFIPNSNSELHFCVNVLLKNKIEADFYLNQMDTNLKSSYEEYPIFTLYKSIFSNKFI